VRTQDTPDNLYIAADKNRYFRLGTYLIHLSIILIILGFLLGGYLGFRHRYFMVPEGSVRELGYDSGLSLLLASFVDEYWTEGAPKDYRSEVVLYDNGMEVKRGTIRVNHPMSYKGTRFYQSFFGPVAVMQVQDSAGELVYEDGVALGWLSGNKPFQRPTGAFSLPGIGMTAYVVMPAQGHFDPLLEPGQVLVELYRDDSSGLVDRGSLEQGVPQTLGGLYFTFVRERQFSGFQVTRDPGNLLIWIASGLFVLGLVSVLYFPHRQVWAHVQHQPPGGSQVSMRTTSTRSFAVAREFEGLAKEMTQALSFNEESGEDKGE
jgi:cytochrome c biogenesis protein